MKPFAEFCAAKVRAAESETLHPLITIEDRSSGEALGRVGNDWTRLQYDGDFHLLSSPDPELPAVSLVFVQSRDGNTGTDDPGELGGGPTDKHLIYEGLSRVAADAVMAGAKTVGGEDVFFSVWHRELASLRTDLGLPRHPAQIVVTGTGCIDVARCRVFAVPEVPVYLIATPHACERLGDALRTRHWVRVVPMEGTDLRRPLQALRRDHGIERISAIGGRTTATALLDERLVQDACLTTTAKAAGEPGTPFYVGKQPPAFAPIVTKRGTDPDALFTYEHLKVRTSSRSASIHHR